MEAEKKEITIDDDGMVQGMSEREYQGLLDARKDMMSYKSRMRDSEGALKNTSGDKEKIENLESKLIREKKLNSVRICALSNGIKSLDDLSLINLDAIEVTEIGEIIGVVEAVQNLKTEKEYLFSSGDSVVGVDTTQGSGKNSGVMTNDEVLALNGAQLMEAKRSNPALYARYSKMALKGRPIPKPVQPGAEGS